MPRAWPKRNSAPSSKVGNVSPHRPSARYYSLKNYLDDRYGRRVAKIALDAGLTCPNRDGSLSDRGCIFCDPRGSGTGASSRGTPISEQVQNGLAAASRRADRFILYFQSFTNTYAPLDRLRDMWDLCLSSDDIVGLAVGTRPDCLPDDVLDLLAEYNEKREVWLEIGLQSASDETLARINRGHTAADFAHAAGRAAQRGLKVIAHAIIGLPGEGPAETLATARFIADLRLDGVKIHSLYVSEGTGMASLLAQGDYRCLTLEEYVDQAVQFLENIPADTVVHRLTGDPDPGILVGPEWTLKKSHVINMIRKQLKGRDTWQGRCLGHAEPS